MTKPAAVFLAVTSGFVALYLAFAAWYLMESATSPVDDALVRGVWVAFGAVAIICLCFIFEAVSERVDQEVRHADSGTE
jgi:zinc transporter ZupT